MSHLSAKANGLRKKQRFTFEVLVLRVNELVLVAQLTARLFQFFNRQRVLILSNEQLLLQSTVLIPQL